MPTSPEISSTSVSYSCPSCKRQISRSIPYIDPKLLSNPKNPFSVRLICRCEAPHQFTYQVRKDKKVKLVEFLCQGSDTLTKVKKSFKLSSNSATR